MASGNRASSSTNAAAAAKGVDSISKAIAQYVVDARFHAVYEQSGESGKSFDYSQSIKTTTDSIAKLQMIAYLSKIQRGGHIQPFGCMIAVDNSTFRVIAFSENARERLDLAPQSVPTLDKPEILTMKLGKMKCEDGGGEDEVGKMEVGPT